MRKVAWCTPFGPASGIGFFSRKVYPIFKRIAKSSGCDVHLYVNENGPLYDYPDDDVFMLNDELNVRNFMDSYDLAVYCIGNNVPNHKKIYDLLKVFPGIVLQMDIVNQHLHVGDVFDVRNEPYLYYLYMTHFYGAEGINCALEGIECFHGRGPMISPWDSPISSAFPLFELSTRLASTILTQSRYAYQRIAARVEAPVYELQNPCDLKDIPTVLSVLRWSNQAKKQKVCVSSFGVIQPGKQLDAVLYSISRSEFLQSNIKYTICGYTEDAGYLAYLKNLVGQFRLGKCVDFKVGLSDQELFQLMIETDVFVNIRFPNSEAGSGSLIEQLGSGKPVVVLNSGCFADVPDGSVIKIDDHTNIDKLSETLERILSDWDGLVQVGANGRDWAFRLDSTAYAQSIFDAAVGNCGRTEVMQAVADVCNRSSAFSFGFASGLKRFKHLATSAPIVGDNKREFVFRSEGTRDFLASEGGNIDNQISEYVRTRQMVEIVDYDPQLRSPYFMNTSNADVFEGFMTNLIIQDDPGAEFYEYLQSIRDDVYLSYVVYAGLRRIFGQSNVLASGAKIEPWDLTVCFEIETWYALFRLPDTVFVRALYSAILSKYPDPGGLAFYLKLLKEPLGKHKAVIHSILSPDLKIITGANLDKLIELRKYSERALMAEAA